MGFLAGSNSKESVCNVGDLGSIPGLGRSPGEGKGYPLQYSGLETVHGVEESQTRLSDFHSQGLGIRSDCLMTMGFPFEGEDILKLSCDGCTIS